MNPILVVDDNEQILNILTQYINKEGWALLTAKTGEEALSLFDAAAARTHPAGYHAAGHRRAGGLPAYSAGIQRSYSDDHRQG